MKHKYKLIALTHTGLTYNYRIECDNVTLAHILAGALIETKACRSIELRQARNDELITYYNNNSK